MFRSILIEHFLIGAYPRSRGENRAEKAHPAFQKGSSPLTRGKQAASRGCCVAARLIPLTRGKQNAAPTGRVLKGLIPSHTGKPGGGLRARRLLRLIPAHAGITLPKPLIRTSSPAHPHSRGENVLKPADARSNMGSSPLTRGKFRVVRAGQVVDGLIPTHAGKTSHNPAHRSASTAHPRPRGENEVLSPPLLLNYGLIPTHAGKTSRRASRLAAPRAHPRSRGENLKFGKTGSEIEGSSPLTRGKLARRRR